MNRLFRCGLLVAMSMLLVGCQLQEARWEPDDIDQFVIVQNIPYVLQDGVLYRYEEDGAVWSEVETDQPVRQMVDKEDFAILYEDGSVTCDAVKYFEPEPGDWLGGNGLAPTYNAQEILAVNQSIAFSQFGGDLTMFPLILAEDGAVIYTSYADDDRDGDEERKRLHLSSDDGLMTSESLVSRRLPAKPIYVTGTFALTEEGNVYLIFTDGGSERAEEIYTGGDLVQIAAAFGCPECIGQKEDGQWIQLQYKMTFMSQLPVEKWENVTTAIVTTAQQAIGLTADGRVVLADSVELEEEGENSTLATNLSTWRDIVAITSCWDKIYGLKKDGSVLVTNMFEGR